jgi:putative oxygen-independent coproporphyrinogen III oxidase
MNGKNMNKPLALYVHWPFCKAKCPYCDFNSHVSDTIDEERFAAAFIKELDHYAPRLKGRRLSSIFFGGGTPSLMSPETVAKVINHADRLWGVDSDVEITLEANPTSFEAEKFSGFKAAGVNRVSMGIQALNDEDLRFLGREHSVTEALQALDKAAGIFDNYTFDLIYARPNQTMEAWEKELEQAMKLINGHMSLYQLTIEKGTPFYAAHQRGEFQLPDDDLAAQLYEHTSKMLSKKDLFAYEVSNYAKLGYESKHNLAYWHYQEYLGIGAGAHSRLRLQDNHIGREALMNLHAPEKWLNAVDEKQNGLQSTNKIEGDDQIFEMLMMGLRLATGIHKDWFLNETERTLHDVLKPEVVAELKSCGYAVEDEDYFRLTPAGLMVHHSIINQVIK